MNLYLSPYKWNPKLVESAMEEAMRALGKTSLKELFPENLVPLDSYTAEATGVKRIY